MNEISAPWDFASTEVVASSPNGGNGKSSRQILPRTLDVYQRELDRSYSKWYEAWKKAHKKRTNRAVLWLMAAVIWSTIWLQVASVTKYFSSKFDRVLFENDLLESPTSWKLRWVKAFADYNYPHYTGFEYVLRHHNLVSISEEDARELGLVYDESKYQPRNITLKVSDKWEVYMEYNMCDFSCSDGMRIMSKQRLKLWLIERGKIYFYVERGLNWAQKKMIADKLRITTE